MGIRKESKGDIIFLFLRGLESLLRNKVSFVPNSTGTEQNRQS